MTEQLLPFLLASIGLTISPGPDILFVLVQGMVNGMKHGVVTALGLVTGIILHTSLVAFGVSALISESPTLLLLIKVLGALYLFYLAFRVYKSRASIDFNAEEVEKRCLFSLFRQGFLMNVLNPKVAIFFLAFFPGFLWEPAGNTLLQFYILGFLFMVQAFVIFSLVSALAGKISKYLRKHPDSAQVFRWLQILVFSGIGIFILI